MWIDCLNGCWSLGRSTIWFCRLTLWIGLLFSHFCALHAMINVDHKPVPFFVNCWPTLYMFGLSWLVILVAFVSLALLERVKKNLNARVRNAQITGEGGTRTDIFDADQMRLRQAIDGCLCVTCMLILCAVLFYVAMIIMLAKFWVPNDYRVDVILTGFLIQFASIGTIFCVAWFFELVLIRLCLIERLIFDDWWNWLTIKNVSVVNRQ